MENSFSFVLLLDIYGELLSKGQREVLDMRYNADLSLSEIAEELGGVTRQSVSYSMKKGEQRLLELESCLGFAARLKTLSGGIDKAKTLLSELSEDYDKNGTDGRLKELDLLLSEIRSGL